MPKPSAFSTLPHLTFWGTLILFVAAPQAVGQNPEPEKVQTENVRPQFYFNTGGPSGLRVEQRGLGIRTNPFIVQAPQTADAVIPKIRYALPPQIPPQQNLCSVPLLRILPNPSMNFTIRQAPAPRMDSAMVVKPLAPSCDEKTSVQKPGLTMPLTPNRR
jgi:hypothetical protein